MSNTENCLARFWAIRWKTGDQLSVELDVTGSPLGNETPDAGLVTRTYKIGLKIRKNNKLKNIKIFEKWQMMI